MYKGTRGQRLGKRYPILRDVPEDERPAIVRAALRHPLLLLLVVGVGLLLLPLYFEAMFNFLGIAHEENMGLFLCKMAGTALLPALLAVPLLSRFVVPGFIAREMRKRGFQPPVGRGTPPSA